MMDLRKMASTGANCKNARYNYLITEPSVGYATIATGAKPSAHGIVSDYWYERLSNQIIYSLDDSEQTTIEGTYGTGALFTHRLCIAGPCLTNCGSSAVSNPNPLVYPWIHRPLYLMAGHTATGAYWIDPAHRFMDFQQLLCGFTASVGKGISMARITRTSTWTEPGNPCCPLPNIAKACWIIILMKPDLNGQITFPYDLSRISAKNRTEKDYSVLMSTPWGNTYTKDLAIAAIVNEELGQRGVSDMIHIGFNATKYLADKYSTWSVEMQDTYLRLDQDIAHLLEFPG